jgi:hypothetical protein
MSLQKRLKKLGEMKIARNMSLKGLDNNLREILFHIPLYYTSLGKKTKDHFKTCLYDLTAHEEIKEPMWQLWYLVIFMWILNVKFPRNLEFAKQYLNDYDTDVMHKINDHLKKSKEIELEDLVDMQDGVFCFKDMEYVNAAFKFIHDDVHPHKLTVPQFEKKFTRKSVYGKVGQFWFLVFCDFIEAVSQIYEYNLWFFNPMCLAGCYKYCFAMRQNFNYAFGDLYYQKVEKIYEVQKQRAKDHPRWHKDSYMLMRTIVPSVLVFFACNLHVSPHTLKVKYHSDCLANTFFVRPIDGWAKLVDWSAAKAFKESAAKAFKESAAASVMQDPYAYFYNEELEAPRAAKRADFMLREEPRAAKRTDLMLREEPRAVKPVDMEEEEEPIEEPRVPIRRAHVEEEVNLSILDLLYMMEGHNMVFHQYKDGYVQTMWGTTNITQQSVKALMDPLKAVCANKVCKWDHSVTIN